MRTLALASMLLAGLCAASCMELPTVESGTCGNKIVDANEDCDGDANLPDGAKCRSAGSVGACRFDCAPGAQCPAGYVCGSDQICRAHSGAFIDVGTSVLFTPTHLLVDDFDGDGRSDVLGYNSNTSEGRALFFEPSGALAKSVSIASDRMVPATGALAGSTASTFTFATRAGLGVMRGQADRSFSPTPYTSIQLPWQNGHVLTLEAMLPGTDFDPTDPYGARWLGDEAMIFHGAYAYVTEDAVLEPGNVNKTTLRLPRDAEPVGPVRVADLDTDPVESPCQEIVLTYGDDEVYVVTPCMRVAGKLVWNRQLGPGGDPVRTYPPITLFDKNKNPVVAPISTVFVTHLNAPPPGAPAGLGQDTHLDLVINAYDEILGTSRIFAAMGDGTGHFAGAVPNGAIEGEPLPDGQKLLAVGDLNLDGKVDFVTSTQILISQPGGGYALAGVPQGGSPFRQWADAAIADFNGDGRPDVICGAGSDVGIDFFTSAPGGALNPLVIATEGGATQFVVGDFDGDLVNDVAFRLVSLSAGGGGVVATPDGMGGFESAVPDSLGVIFGRFGQPPEAPRNLGQLSRIESIVTGRTVVNEAPSDGISDLGVVTSSLTGSNVRSVAIFQGRGDRQLQSPFGLNIPGQDPFSDKLVIGTTIGQFDDSDAASHLDIVALVQESTFKVGPDNPDPTAAPSTVRYVFWMLPVTGTASLDISTARAVELKTDAYPNVDWSGVQMATIDVDGDGKDEVALVMPYYDDAKQNYVLGVAVVQRGSDGGAKLVGPFPLSDELYYGGFGPAVGTGDVGDGAYYFPVRPALCVADVDGDDKPDLVTFASDAEYRPRVVVLYGTKDKDAPFEAAAGHVTLPDEPYINAYTCANLDLDKESELVILGSDHAYSVDLKGRKVSAPVLLEGVSAGSVVAAGDFDGDEITDLVVVTNNADTRIYRGKPVIQ